MNNAAKWKKASWMQNFFHKRNLDNSGKANLKFMQCCYGFYSVCIALSHLWEGKFISWAFGDALNISELECAAGKRSETKMLRMFFLMPTFFLPLLSIFLIFNVSNAEDDCKICDWMQIMPSLCPKRGDLVVLMCVH